MADEIRLVLVRMILTCIGENILLPSNVILVFFGPLVPVVFCSWEGIPFSMFVDASLL